MGQKKRLVLSFILGLWHLSSACSPTQRLTNEDIIIIKEHADTAFAYIPAYLKETLIRAHQYYRDLHIDVALCDQAMHIAPYDATYMHIKELLALIAASDTSHHETPARIMLDLHRYLSELESNKVFINDALNVEEENDGTDTRVTNLFSANSGTALMAAGTINVLGGSNINTTGSGSTVIVDLAGTTNHAVQIGNSSGNLTSLNIGTNGQVLLGATNANPTFGSITSPTNNDSASSVLFTTGAGSLALQSIPLLGNTIRVDAINGNNSTATATNGLPFLTISAALTAAATIATASRPIVIWVLPGIYNETITMQQYVSVVGLSEGAGAEGSPTSGVIIQQLGVTASTTLVTMADYSRLENVSLNLTNTSGSPTNLIGILFPSGTTANATARVKSISATISSSSSGSGINVIGIQSASTGTPNPEICAVRTCVISASSTNATSSSVVGVSVISGAGQSFNIIASNIVASTTDSTNTAYGVNLGANASCTVNTSILSGTNSGLSSAGADINNANGGTLTLSHTRLINSTTNGTAFTTATSALTPLVWLALGAIGNTSTRYLVPGSGAAATINAENVVQFPMPQACVAQNLRVKATVAPGTGFTTTVTLRKNGVSTTLTAQLAGASLTASDLTHAVSFAVGDLLSIQLATTTASTQNIVVIIDLY